MEDKTRYVIHTTVRGVLLHSKRQYVSGSGRDAEFRDDPIGYFVHLEGSHEAINLGPEAPALSMGDKVKITIEKV